MSNRTVRLVINSDDVNNVTPVTEKDIKQYLVINSLYTGRLFHHYMLDESIYHFMGVGSILSLFYSIFGEKSC